MAWGISNTLRPAIRMIRIVFANRMVYKWYTNKRTTWLDLR